MTRIDTVLTSKAKLTERQRFERWAKRLGYNTASADGIGYDSMLVDHMWMGWQARSMVKR